MKYTKEALDYLGGWYEGDNITITADFLNNVDTLKEYVEELEKKISILENYKKSYYDLKDKTDEISDIIEILKKDEVHYNNGDGDIICNELVLFHNGEELILYSGFVDGRCRGLEMKLSDRNDKWYVWSDIF